RLVGAQVHRHAAPHSPLVGGGGARGSAGVQGGTALQQFPGRGRPAVVVERAEQGVVGRGDDPLRYAAGGADEVEAAGDGAAAVDEQGEPPGAAAAPGEEAELVGAAPAVAEEDVVGDPENGRGLALADRCLPVVDLPPVVGGVVVAEGAVGDGGEAVEVEDGAAEALAVVAEVAQGGEAAE